MFDINPETHRHHLAEIERQMQPRMRDFRDRDEHGNIPERFRVSSAAVAVAAFVLGGMAGGALL